METNLAERTIRKLTTLRTGITAIDNTAKALGLGAPTGIELPAATGRTLEQINEVIGADTLGYLSNEHVVQLAKNAKCGFCTACFTGEYAVEPESVLSTDIHDRHLNDRPKDAK